jgi:hypothetical protein
MEDILIREKVLPSDFVFVICRNKKHAVAPGQASARRAPRERRFVGCIDLFDGRTIAGWAADVRDPAIPIQVEIYLDGQLQASGLSDGFRQDVKDAGYGDGRKGFVLSLDSPSSSSSETIAKLQVAGSDRVLSTRFLDVRSA